MQVLRQKVEKTMLQKGYKSLMITSSIQGEGKSTVSANLAISLAQKGYKVILVDGDLYHPVLTEMFHLKGMENGLVDYLNGTEGVSHPVLPEIFHVRRAAYVSCGYE